MPHNKPIASLSLDLDNQWSYMKTHGDAGWDTFPSYLDLVVPRILEFLKKRELVITFFIVGQDAALEKNAAAIRSIAEAGHEIGNHSFHHEQWLQFYTDQQLEEEIASAEKQIESLTSYKPIGFRGPGYSLSRDTLAVLERRGYVYDASILSTYLGPLARMYYFLTAKLSEDEKRKRASLFGSIQDGFRPNHPFRWLSHNGDENKCLVEMPVTTIPIFKIPFHVSYILYISNFSPALAIIYFQFALLMCRLTRTCPTLLLHPLDFLGKEDIKELSFFPAMNLPLEAKLRVIDQVLRLYAETFNVVTMRQHVQTVAQSQHIIDPESFFKS